ncbi:MAG: transposase [Planctomycetota bacterium]
MTHVKTSPYYPQRNSKIERYHRTIKGDCIRTKHFETPEQARAEVDRYVVHYNTARLHSAIGYMTPQQKLEGREKAIFAERDKKLEAARKRRCEKHAQTKAAVGHKIASGGTSD